MNIRTLTIPAALSLACAAFADRAGDRKPVTAIHPGYTLENIRPAAMDFPIGGMDFLSDGTLAVTSWRDPYGVYLLKRATGPKAGITVAPFANGLTESLGLKVVHDTVFVLQKDELTALIDGDGDGVADQYRAVAYDWTKSTMEKEYATGLAYDGKYFYGAFGDPTVESGTAVNPAPAGRQNGVLRMGRDGKVEPWSGGMRVPGGIEFALGDVWVTENQGGYRPSNYLIDIRQGRWYNRPINPPSVFQTIAYRNFPDDGPHKPVGAPFTVDLPFMDAGGRSPGNPVFLKDGPFKGQMFVPDADGSAGGICRVFLEQIKGEWQGAVFHFSRGFESKTVYRLVQGPDGAFYAGANGSDNAGWGRKTHIGLDRMKPNGNVAFEMLAVRSKGAGAFEIEFTKPLAASLGADVAAHLEVEKWWDRPQEAYGQGRKQDTTWLKVTAAAVSADRKKVAVTLTGSEEGWEHYFHWKGDILATDVGEKLWGTEAWYMLNQNGPGTDPVVSLGAADIIRPAAGALRCLATVSGLRVLAPPEVTGAFIVEIRDSRGRLRASAASAGNGFADFASADFPKGMLLVRLLSGGRAWSSLFAR